MTPSTPWWGSRNVLYALLAILVVAAAFRVVIFRGYVGLDDAEYARFAHHLANGTHVNGYTGPAVFPLRVGITVPTSVAFRLFGENEWSMVLYPFIVSLSYIVVAFVCAALLFGWQAGLIAAALVSIFPWDFDTATKLLPDPPGALFQGVAVTILIATQRLWATASARRLSVSGAAAGLALGLAWLSKESVSYLGPFCAAVLLLTVRRHGSRALWFWVGLAAAAGVLLGGEIAYYAGTTNDPLFRFHEIERNYRQWQNGFFTEGSDYGWDPGQTYSQALLHRLLVAGPSVFFLDRSLLFLPLVGLVATIWAWRRRDGAFLIPALWLWTLVLMFNFSSSSATAYIPLALFQRYVYPVFLPAIVLSAGFIARTLDLASPQRANWLKPSMRWAGVAAALFVLWAAAPQLYFTLRTPSNWWMGEMRLLKDRLRPETTLYSDTLTLRALEFYSHYPDPSATKWTDFADLPSGATLPAGSLVLINKQYIEWLDKNAGMWLAWPMPELSDPAGYRRHPFYTDPPAGWRRLWSNHNAALYEVGSAAVAAREEGGRP